MNLRKTKVFRCLGMMVTLSIILSGVLHAEGEIPQQPYQPWEKFSVNVGAFISNIGSSARVGAGLGVDLDLEKLLGLDATSTVFRVDSGWRFTQNRRHRVEASWFALHRSAHKNVGEDFDVTKPDGSVETIKAGTDVSSHFNLDIVQTLYSYSFFQDDRADLAVGGGFYVMPINFGLKADNVGETEASLKFTAPLPVVSLRMDFSLTPKWFIRNGGELFYAEYNGFKGKLVEMRCAVEYLPINHVGVGLGIDSMNANFEGPGKDYPNIDLNGKIQFQYTGLQLYGKYFF